MMLPWDDYEPTPGWLFEAVVALFVVGLILSTRFPLSHQTQKSFLADCGVKAKRIKRAISEIERKSFHVCGLLVPTIHMLLLEAGASNRTCQNICWIITGTGWCADLSRLYIPAVARNWPGRSILRPQEHHQLTGSCYFSLGCTLSIALSPPLVAMVSIIFLVLGDMSAAIIGVSFGGETVALKLGRAGKKSIEGSVAMFTVCFVTGCIMFAGHELREYFVFIGALVATLTELFEPLGLNDNLTIPLFSTISMQWGMARVRSCASPSARSWLIALMGT